VAKPEKYPIRNSLFHFSARTFPC